MKEKKPRPKPPPAPPKPGGPCGLCGGSGTLYTRGKPHKCTRCKGSGVEPR